MLYSARSALNDNGPAPPRISQAEFGTQPGKLNATVLAASAVAGRTARLRRAPCIDRLQPAMIVEHGDAIGTHIGRRALPLLQGHRPRFGGVFVCDCGIVISIGFGRTCELRSLADIQVPTGRNAGGVLAAKEAGEIRTNPEEVKLGALPRERRSAVESRGVDE